VKQLPNSLKAIIPIAMLILGILACVPQDCMGITFWVEGYIMDEADNPISNAEVRAWNEGSYEKPAFDHHTTSNGHGYFKTDGAFSYGCISFQVEVSAEGYETQTLKFYPPSEGFDDELPAELTIQLQVVTMK
jgi:hypothetical protein